MTHDINKYPTDIFKNVFLKEYPEKKEYIPAYDICELKKSYSKNGDYTISPENREYADMVATFLSKYYMCGDSPYGGVSTLPYMSKDDWDQLHLRMDAVYKQLKDDYEYGLWNEIKQYFRLSKPPKGKRRPNFSRISEILTYKLFTRPLIATKVGARNFLYT